MFKKDSLLTQEEIKTLASIVQVGDATYFDLLEAESPMFGHRYFADVKGRIRTTNKYWHKEPLDDVLKIEPPDLRVVNSSEEF